MSEEKPISKAWANVRALLDVVNDADEEYLDDDEFEGFREDLNTVEAALKKAGLL